MSQPANILILFAHPSLHTSRVNRAMIEAVSTLPNVRVNDLYDNYPDFFIDVQREQALLLQADLIVYQFPMFWYSAPALLSQWQEKVLEHGFGYGQEGNAVEGKEMMLVISTGAPPQAFSREGHANFTIDTLLCPFEQAANLSGLIYRQPLLLQGTANLSDEAIQAHANTYRQLLADYSPKAALEDA